MCSVLRNGIFLQVQNGLNVKVITHHHLLSGSALHEAAPSFPTRLRGVVLIYGQDKSRPTFATDIYFRVTGWENV